MILSSKLKFEGVSCLFWPLLNEAYLRFLCLGSCRTYTLLLYVYFLAYYFDSVLVASFYFVGSIITELVSASFSAILSVGRFNILWVLAYF